MSDISSLYNVDLESGRFTELTSCNAAELKIKEKQIEEWMAHKPNLLFTDEDSVEIIAQEITGKPQADLLAVDSQGNLIIIEIKRHWSDRNTIGQLLDYAAALSECNYDFFNDLWKKYKGKASEDLFEYFKRDFIENTHFEKDQFLKEKRLFILASEADEDLKRIIGWLKNEHEVPIDFVPFAFFQHGDQIFLRIDKIEIEPISYSATFEGDWFFNSNESHSPGAWKNMIDHNVIAACKYGKQITKYKMDKPAAGDRVFVYVNGKGIVAAGKVLEEVSGQGSGIFNKDTEGDEFHRKVEWLVTVPIDDSISSAEVSELGYNLPVRCTIAQWNDGKVAEKVIARLKETAGK